jgi:hypothetical protein
MKKHTHYNHDESFYYNLKNINFDVFLTVHFKRWQYYSQSKDADCMRRRLFRENFANITYALGIPRKSLFYFGTAEADCDDKMHCHILLKYRKDVILTNQEKLKGIDDIFLFAKDYLRNTEINQRRVELVNNSQNAANYMLKLKTFDQKRLKAKENYYHSKNFTYICEYMKAGLW